MGKYHPHGDQAIYDTLVGLAQDFTSRYPLVDPQGNFGSIDGDAAAATRYTEARLSRIAEELLTDIKKDTVDFVPNFDESLKEPVVMPARLPNLLLNGSTGIAVGMACHFPPHNLGEVCRAVTAYIDNPEMSLAETMKIMPGPDFPTGGAILGRSGILEAYQTGRGKLTVRGRTTIEEPKKKNGREKIVISEIPFQINKARLVEQIAKLVRNKTIEGISDLRDESDRRGLRVVIDLKRDANAELIINHLHRHTQLQGTFGVINLALVNKEPQYLPLHEIFSHFINHRIEVVERRSRYELAHARQRAHIVEGLMLALDDIDNIVNTLRAATNVHVAAEKLMSGWSFSAAQAKAILEMRLSRLVALERDKLSEEYDELRKKIAYLEELLGSRTMIQGLIKDDLLGLAEKYGDPRRTAIVAAEQELSKLDFVADEQVVVAITHQGYIKRMEIDAYKTQGRGGSGVTGISTKEEDFVDQLFIAYNHDYLLCFTTSGRCYWLRVFDIPMASRLARGKAIVNLLKLDKDERLNAVVPVRDLDSDKHYLVMATAQGYVKRIAVNLFSNVRKDGIYALTLRPEDHLIGVRLTDGKQQVVLATRYGKAMRCEEAQFRAQGRSAQGVIGVKLSEENSDDAVVGMAVVDSEKLAESGLLTATVNGYGKRTPVEEYRLINRGGQGVINIKTTLRNGAVIATRLVDGSEEMLMMSEGGMVVRTRVADVSEVGRNTQGVRLMRMKDDDHLSAIAILVNEDEEPVEPEETSSPQSS
ncbi:DNA gyrase subunit A, partial [bacterium]|nr:DNA gyrase subunit A [bacterium]